MNKYCYRVIFSKSQQRFVVVSELAKKEGKAKAEVMSLDTTSQITEKWTALFSNMAHCSLKPLSFALCCAWGFVTFIPQVQAQNEQLIIKADPTATANQRPQVIETANGIPQVNIQTPNQQGMSYNRYAQFDVDKKGAILNNSRQHTQTQLGGWVQANPYLVGGEAKVIVNEVNSNKPSQLKGYVEVAGQKADVIIANPSGLHCEGCGVINANRATLTTGKPQFKNGHLDRFVVEKGKVTVTGKGMDNSQSDYTDIIAREAQINAGVWSKKAVNVTTGQNKVSKNNDAVQIINSKSLKNQKAENEVEYALDVSNLGGMYAEKIHLIGTEEGLGVRNAGNIGASAGDVVIDVNGKVLNTNQIQAQQQLKIKSKEQIENTSSGKLIAQQGNLELHTEKSLTQSGIIGAGQQLTTKVGGGLIQNKDGQLQGADVHIDAKGKVTNRGLINSRTDKPNDIASTVIKAKHIENIGTGRIYGDKVALGAEQLHNHDEKTDSVVSPIIAARQRLDIGVKHIINENHHYSGDVKGATAIYSGDSLYIGGSLNEQYDAIEQATRLDNNSALIESQGNMKLNIANINNTNRFFETELRLISETEIDWHYIFPAGVSEHDLRLDMNLVYWHERSRGRNGYIAKGVPNEIHKPKNGDVQSNYLPEVNQCLAGEGANCDLIADSYYFPTDPAWEHFAIKPNIRDNLSDLLNTAKIPVEPRAPIEPNKPDNANEQQLKDYEKRLADYQKKKSIYDAEYQAYLQDKVYFDEKVKPAYWQWVKDNETAFAELQKHVLQHNQHRASQAGQRYEAYWKTDVKRRIVKEDVVKKTQAGEILSGGSLVINTDKLLNDKSRVISGENLFFQQGKIENVNSEGRQITETYGDRHYSFLRKRKSKTGSGRNKYRREHNQWHSGLLTQQNKPITLPVANVFDNYAFDSESLALKSTGENIPLPSSRLYKINPEAESHVLVETDPAFADRKKWLSGDYMFNILRSEHNAVHKRLGDGYYEQRLIRDQINQLTGRQFLGNYQDMEQQYKALMDSGILFAQKFNLRPGISLSEAQIKQLTTDIVWFEPQIVILPDGSQQRVLVPTVYTVPHKNDVNSVGTLIASKNISLNTQLLQNTGAIVAEKQLDIHANNLANQGKLDAQQVIINADRLSNLGGEISAQDTLKLNVKQDLLHQSQTYTTHINAENYKRDETHLARQASIYVKGQQGNLSITADNLTVQGANIINTGVGNTSIHAKNQFNLTALETVVDEKMGAGDNYRNERVQDIVISRVSGGGDVRLQSSNLRAEAAQLEAEQKLIAIAENDLLLNSASKQLDYSEYHHMKSGSFLSKTKNTRYDEIKEKTYQGTDIQAQNVILQAGKRLSAEALSVEAEQDIKLHAKEIELNTAKNQRNEIHWQETKKSGLGGSLKGGVASFGYQRSKAGSETKKLDENVVTTELSAKGNINVLADEMLLLSATDLKSAGDISLKGNDVKLIAVSEKHQQHNSQYAKSSGFSVGFTYSPLWASVKAAQDQINSQGGLKNQSAIGKVMTIADTGYEVIERLSKPIVMSMGTSSNSLKQTHFIDKSVTGSIVAGNNLNIQATKKDIGIEGAQVQAEGDFIVSAKGSILLEAVKSSNESSADRKQKGISFDTSKSLLKNLGVYRNKENENANREDFQQTVISVGGNSILKAGEDIRSSGVDIVSDGNITLFANNNIELGTTQSKNAYQAKSKGVGFGSAKISDTESFTGVYLDKSRQNANQTLHKGSVIGSNKGNVNIYAGKDYVQDSSAVMANNGELNIVAKGNVISRTKDNVSLASGKTSNTKVGGFAKVSSPLLDVANLVQEAKSTVEDDKAESRLKVLKGAMLGLQGYSAYQSIMSGALLRAEAGVGFKHGQSSYEQRALQSQGNLLNASKGISINTELGKIDLSHIEMTTKDQTGKILPDSYVLLKSKQGIYLDSGREEASSKSKQSNFGAQVGVGVQVGAGTGAYAYVEAGYQRGKQAQHDHQKYHSHVVTNHFKAQTDGDMSLKGASVHANKIDADIKGNLEIISQQDHHTSSSSQTGANIRAQISFGTAWGAGSFSQQKGQSEMAQVTEQSGFFAGDRGYNISADKVNLVGGAIVSKADKSKNSLSAQDFSFTDIRNYSHAKASGLALMGGFSVNRDQTSAEDKHLNAKYRAEKEAKGETFKAANPNQQNVSALKFGLNANDVHSNDFYAASKLLLVNALGNAKASENHHAVTHSVISEGKFNISSTSGQQQIEAITKSTQAENQQVKTADKDKLMKDVEIKTEVNKFLLSQAAGFTDEEYHKMFISEHRMMGFVTDENGNPVKDPERLEKLEKLGREEAIKKGITDQAEIKQYVRDYYDKELGKGYNIYQLYELSDQERQHIKPVTYTDPNTGKQETKYFVAFNGILNDIQAAAKFARQNYIAGRDAQTGTLSTPLYENVYFVHHPKANNIVSELLIAGYQKWTVSADNSVKQAIDILKDKGNSQQGLYLGSHSRGTLTISNALQTLYPDKQNAGLLANTTLKMVGPAANVSKADNILNYLQGKGEDRMSKEGAILIENSQHDTVGSSLFIGNNPYTINTNLKNKGSGVLLWDIAFGESSSHNCYGLGQKQCGEDGYRDEKDNRIMQPEKTIFEFNQDVSKP
ncbi:two-partner secretion domain-containing protein [Pasteurella dagmatis]|nr:hemagglutinin repeat-containing protein [Pasteurella dagmatis]SNV62635.1 protein PfhB1 [Pasteurella dagmatis]